MLGLKRKRPRNRVHSSATSIGTLMHRNQSTKDGLMPPASALYCATSGLSVESPVRKNMEPGAAAANTRKPSLPRSSSP